MINQMKKKEDTSMNEIKLQGKIYQRYVLSIKGRYQI